jgi:hypothetical protein
MTGLLVGAGLSDEEAQIFSAGLEKGGTLVVLRIGPEHRDLANSILARGNARDTAGNTHVAGRSQQTKVEPSKDKTATGGAKIDDPIADKSSSPVIKADRVKGTSVYDQNGKHLGVVDKLMIHKLSGRVEYVVMSFGGIHGMGEEQSFVPWRTLTYDTHLQGYRARITEDQVRAGIDPSH